MHCFTWQVLSLERQYSPAGQSPSLLQPCCNKTQVFCGEQARPEGQSPSARHCTQLPLAALHTGVGFTQSELAWQTTGATQWCEASQTGLERSLQSVDCRHWTQACCE